VHGKNVALCKILFELVSDFRPNLDQIWNKLDQKICTHYIAEKFDKSQKRILLITFCFVFLFSSWFLWFSTFFLSHSYFLMILRIQHIRFGGGIREIQGGIFLFLTVTILLYVEFSAQNSILHRQVTYFFWYKSQMLSFWEYVETWRLYIK